MQKPQDLLEFLRRANREAPAEAEREPAAPAKVLERTTRMLVLRRSQVVVASVAAGLLLVLAFLLGLGLGGGGGESTETVTVAGPPVWTIRAATFSDTEKGRFAAKVMAGDLRRRHDIRQVVIQPIPSRSQLVVVVGAWLEHPHDDRFANDLLKKIKDIPDVNGDKPLADAIFWRIQR